MEIIMFLNTAYIFCAQPKTDDELRAIMETRNGFPSYGFRKVDTFWDPNEWKEFREDRDVPADIYLDIGFDVVRSHWISKYTVFPAVLLPMPAELLDFSVVLREDEEWWALTAKLVINRIPPSYLLYEFEYGEIEDEYEPGQAEEAWKDLILANYNYDPKIVAEFEAA
jgi:hypothetical protein